MWQQESEKESQNAQDSHSGPSIPASHLPSPAFSDVSVFTADPPHYLTIYSALFPSIVRPVPHQLLGFAETPSLWYIIPFTVHPTTAGAREQQAHPPQGHPSQYRPNEPGAETTGALQGMAVIVEAQQN